MFHCLERKNIIPPNFLHVLLIFNYFWTNPALPLSKTCLLFKGKVAWMDKILYRQNPWVGTSEKSLKGSSAVVEKGQRRPHRRICPLQRLPRFCCLDPCSAGPTGSGPPSHKEFPLTSQRNSSKFCSCQWQKVILDKKKNNLLGRTALAALQDTSNMFWGKIPAPPIRSDAFLFELRTTQKMICLCVILWFIKHGLSVLYGQSSRTEWEKIFVNLISEKISYPECPENG